MGINTVFNQSCSHKQRFRSLKSAQKRVNHMAKRGVMITEKNIYQCDFCGGWHLGHSFKIEQYMKKAKIDNNSLHPEAG